MPRFTNNMTQIAFSVYEDKGVFAVLLGSGLSHAAGIPMGWEITIDLIKRGGNVQGITDQADWAKWLLQGGKETVRIRYGGPRSSWKSGPAFKKVNGKNESDSPL